MLNATLSTSYSIVCALLRVAALFEHGCFVFGGMFEQLSLSDRDARAAFNVMAFLWLAMHFTTLLLFLYRYAQTCNESLCRWLSSFNTAFPIGMAAYLVAAALGILPTNLALKMPSEFKPWLAKTDGGVFEQLSAWTVIGLPVSDLCKSRLY